MLDFFEKYDIIKIQIKIYGDEEVKKLYLLLLCAIFQCGCTKQPQILSVSDDDINETETGSTMPTMTEFKTDEVPTTSTQQIEQKNMGKAVYKKIVGGVEISFDDKQYTLTIDDSSEIVDITTTDFNFDGIDDIFINYKKYSQYPKIGRYFRYDTETDSFIDWNELNEISEGYLMKIEDSNEISVKFYSYYGDETYYYKWEGENPIRIGFLDYDLSSGFHIFDYYEYNKNDDKILVKRTVKDQNNDTILKELEYPPYFKVNENSIDVMCNGEVIQTIDDTNVCTYVEYLKNEYSKQVPMEGGVREPEKYLIESDFDFDGYSDLCFPNSFEVNTISLNSAYKYYRFEPETERYVLWDELNDIGDMIFPNYDNQTLESFDNNEKNIYEWKDESLVIVQR